MSQRQLAGLGGAIALVIVAGVIVAYAGPVGSIGATPVDREHRRRRGAGTNRQ